MSINKTKTAAVITVLLMALVALMTITSEAEIVGEVGTTSPTISGYPKLGPLPAGVTPHETWTTIAYLSLCPKTVGVGQEVLVNVWISPGTTNWLYMAGYTVTVQDPNGDEEVIGPFNSYLSDNTAWFKYRVDKVGTWRFKFDHPGTYIPAGIYVMRPGQLPKPFADVMLEASIYYAPCRTDWINLTVQSEMVYSWPSVPLPTDYWRRPISAENRDWWPIGGNYPWTGVHYYPGGRVLYSSNYKFTYGVQAPNTAHIAWRRQGAFGGLIGGEESYQYSAYTGGGSPTIVYQGRCYQTLTKDLNGQLTDVWECYDLRTGQVYWDRVGITSSIAPNAILYETPIKSEEIVLGQEGSGTTVSLVRLASSRLLKYNPYTGAVTSNISLPTDLATGVTSGTSIQTNPGAIYNNDLVYSIQTLKNPAVVNYTYSDPRGDDFRLISWTMRGTSTNFTSRIGLNISWPLSRPPRLGTTKGAAFDWDAGIAVVGTMEFDVSNGPNGTWVPTMQTAFGTSAWNIGYNLTAFDVNNNRFLYSIGANDTLRTMMEESTVVVDRGKVAYSCNVGQRWICFDARTGQLAWDSEQLADPWGNFGAYSTQSYDFNETKGAIIVTTYAGVYAIDWDNGKILWFYRSPLPPFESPYNDEAFHTRCMSADGKIYAYAGEHSTTQPITRGWKIHCINATTGEGIWKMTGPMAPGAIADGYLTASNPYDGYMYVFGKGKSATTVTAPNTAVPKGTAVLVGGTVMDMSPGDQGSFDNPTARLDSPTAPGTVPCVSKDSMSTMMEYVYMQHPIDGLYHNETITGVPVFLTAIDSHGSVVDIGTTTTNGYYGTFSMAWTPPSEDTYTVTANFAGDGSYGSSSGATALTVGPAPAPIEFPQSTTPVDNTMMLNGILVAVIIAILIGLAALIAVFRRK